MHMCTFFKSYRPHRPGKNAVEVFVKFAFRKGSIRCRQFLKTLYLL